MENCNINDGSIITPQLIEHYLYEARQAYVSSKEAASRSAAYIYLTWKATLSDWAKAADRRDMMEEITSYDKEIEKFNDAIDTLKKNAKKKDLKPEDLDTKPSLSADDMALYQKLVALVRSGKTFETKDYRKVTANSNRNDASPFAPLIKYALGLDRPEDSSTVSRYVSVVSFLHSSEAAKMAKDASELVKLIEAVGGFERAVLWQRGNKALVKKPTGNKAEKSKAIAAQVKEALKAAPAVGNVTMDAHSAKEGFVVLVGRAGNGKVDVIGELPVANMDHALSSYQDDTMFPVAPMTNFLGRVLALGQLVEEGRLTGRTVNGTTAGEKQREQRTFTLVPVGEGHAEVLVSALYADASVVVKAVPHHKDIALGQAATAKMMKRDDYLVLEEDVVDIIERRLVTVTAKVNGSALVWTLKNTALVNEDGTGGEKDLTWSDLSASGMTPLTIEGFRPKCKVLITEADIAYVLDKRYTKEDATSKASTSSEAFLVEFLDGAFSPATKGEVGAGGSSASEPIGIWCREMDAYRLFKALVAQKAGPFTFEVDLRGLLAVSWSDDVGNYKVFVPARMTDGGLNPSRIAPLEVSAAPAAEEPVAA